MTPKRFAGWLALLALTAQAQLYVSAPATGSPAPASAGLAGVVSSGNLSALIGCDRSAAFSMTLAATRQAIAPVAGKSIHVCGFILSAGGRTTARLLQGSGGHCASGLAPLTPEFHLARGGSVAFGNSLGRLFQTGPGNAVCVAGASSEPLSAFLIYTVF
jgi:hypothetical protein